LNATTKENNIFSSPNTTANSNNMNAIIFIFQTCHMQCSDNIDAIESLFTKFLNPLLQYMPAIQQTAICIMFQGGHSKSLTHNQKHILFCFSNKHSPRKQGACKQ